MNFKEISTEEAQKHPEYGFGGGLYLVYVVAILWSLHSAYIVFLDTDYKLVLFYGYENFTMADFTSFIQLGLTLPFLYLAPRLNPVMPSVAVSLFSVNWMIWFTFGMISPRAIPVAIVVSLVSAFMIIYIMRSTRVNVTYRNRVPE
ncbi:MAG: hypothetical protein ACPGQV_09725 [Alphaproteobacteria bacterium]